MKTGRAGVSQKETSIAGGDGHGVYELCEMVVVRKKYKTVNIVTLRHLR